MSALMLLPDDRFLLIADGSLTSHDISQLSEFLNDWLSGSVPSKMAVINAPHVEMVIDARLAPATAFHTRKP